MLHVARYYYQLRIVLHKKRWLHRSAQIIRGWCILGPFRLLATRYVQWRKAVQPLPMVRRDLFPMCEIHSVVNALHEKGYANGWKLPDKYVTQIAAAYQKFGDRIKTVLGEKGTMFFEDTSSFHKASRCHTKRLMLSIDYVLQRQTPPERPICT